MNNRKSIGDIRDYYVTFLWIGLEEQLLPCTAAIDQPQRKQDKDLKTRTKSTRGQFKN